MSLFPETSIATLSVATFASLTVTTIVTLAVTTIAALSVTTIATLSVTIIATHTVTTIATLAVTTIAALSVTTIAGPGRVAQSVTCLATDASLNADPGVASLIPARSHTILEINHEMISTVILRPCAESFKKCCCQLQGKVCA